MAEFINLLKNTFEYNMDFIWSYLLIENNDIVADPHKHHSSQKRPSLPINISRAFKKPLIIQQYFLVVDSNFMPKLFRRILGPIN